MNSSEKLLFSEKDAAFILDVSKSFLQKSRVHGATMISNGDAPPYRKKRGRIKYHKQDLKDFADKLPKYGELDKNYEQPNKVVVVNSVVNPSLIEEPPITEDWASLMS